jgi:hypothetical protein
MASEPVFVGLLGEELSMNSRITRPTECLELADSFEKGGA